jgi:sugar phosphate isomerase/epimerase
MIRLGGPLFTSYTDPAEWVATVTNLGYRAAYCPLEPDAPHELVNQYARAAQDADIVIAEVGAWSNPLSPDLATRNSALERCKNALALADAIGARCCVNIAGSRGEKWDGPCEDDLTTQTFELIVESVRNIIDAVQPVRAFYTLETMPWMYPDSTQSYLDLIRAIDRKAFAVHFDPVNIINSPDRYFNSGALIREFIEKLGPRIQSCHAKDILLRDHLTVHLDEVCPGLGRLDYRTYLRSLNALPTAVPLMLEHLPEAQEYLAAGAYIRAVASEEKIAL